jgi:hypothetical protein
VHESERILITRVGLQLRGAVIRPPRWSIVLDEPVGSRAPTASLARSASLTLDPTLSSQGPAATRRTGGDQGTGGDRSPPRSTRVEQDVKIRSMRGMQAG